MHAASDLQSTRTHRLADARLYLCTDARREHDDLADFAEAALAGGVDIIQLRDKGSAGEKRFGPLEITEALGALAILRAAATRHGALLAVNDRADLALAAQADVLHLGQKDLPVAYARQILGPDVMIGRSTNNDDQARRVDSDHETGYFCVGPVWATPTKPGRAASGLSLVESTARRNPVHPWFAIGGIDLDNVGEVVAAGARRIVVVRAITEAADPEAAARQLKAALPS